MKRGQTLSMDLLLGLTAFIVIFIAIFGFVNYLTRESSPARIKEEADLILASIESQDNPLAFIRNNELNQEILSKMDYEELREIIGTKYNFCIYFEDESGKLLALDGQVADPTVHPTSIGPGSPLPGGADSEFPEDQNILINGIPCGQIP